MPNFLGTDGYEWFSQSDIDAHFSPAPPELLYPWEWEEDTGLHVLDPDGWRFGVPSQKLAPKRYDEKIEKQEFFHRAYASTCIDEK